MNQALVDRYKRELQEALAAIGGSTSPPPRGAAGHQGGQGQGRAGPPQPGIHQDNRQDHRLRHSEPGGGGQLGAAGPAPDDAGAPGNPAALDPGQLQGDASSPTSTSASPPRSRWTPIPGVKFKGRVDSIMAGTGSAFSLLPPENATGNWVKVVQRIPVKISAAAALPRQPAAAPGHVHRGHHRHPGAFRPRSYRRHRRTGT